MSPASVRKIVAPVRCLFADARDHGLVRFDPIAGLRIGTPHVEINGDEDEGENTKALEPEELERLLAEIPAEWREFFDFLYETACRIGEAIEARYGDVDAGKCDLHVQRRYYRGTVKKPKGRKTRHVPLSRARVQALWARAATAEDELVYTSTTGKRIDPHNLAARVLKPAAVRAGLGEWVNVEGWVYDKTGRRRRRKPRAESWVHLHTFRHTRATDLFEEEGWPIEAVSKLLGHATPEFTRRVYVWDRNPTVMPELPEDRVATQVATRADQTGRETGVAVAAEIPGFPAGTRPAEAASANS